jgi:amino acid permease
MHTVDVLPEELAAFVSKVYLLSWWRRAWCWRTSWRDCLSWFYSIPTELVKACMVSTYFLKNLPLLVLKYTYLSGEGVHCVDVLPEELAALVSKVYLQSWWRRARCWRTSWRDCLSWFYSIPTELVKACMVSTYFLKSLPLLVLKYTYWPGEGVLGFDVLPEELAALVSKVYLLRWWRRAYCRRTSWRACRSWF